MTSADGALRRYAPAADRDLRRMEAAAWSEADLAQFADLIELASRVCASQHGLEPLVPPGGRTGSRWEEVDAGDWMSSGDLDRRHRAALDFASQFSVDVSGVTDAQRTDLFDQLGDSAANFAAVVFVLDFLPRTWAALDALFGFDAGAGAGAGAGASGGGPVDGPPGIWQALDSFTRTVPTFGALDPVTTELVRLRGARQHQCRLCSSLRNRSALVAGADADAFAAVDHYPTSALSAEQKAALSFTDAMLWTPGRIDPAVTSRLNTLLSPEQRVELILDVTRNALNKVAVALAADAPHVDEGVEIFDVEANGELAYGLTLD